MIIAGRNRTRGYILLMVLVAMIILMTALTSVATRSLKTSQQAKNAAALLQQRWGMTTSKNLFLPSAGRAFQIYERMQQANPRALRARTNQLAESVTLGGQRFDLVIADENAKVNLNTLYHLGGSKKVSDAIRSAGGLGLLRSTALRAAVQSTSRFQAKASPAEGSDGDGLAGRGSLDLAQSALPAFRSWGEIFDVSRMKRESADGLLKFDFMKTLTLWGNGQVNIRRSTDEVIVATLEGIMTSAAAKSLLKDLRASDDIDLQVLAESKLTNPTERRAMLSLIGLSSFSFSLFVDVDAPQGRSRRFLSRRTMSMARP